VKGQWHETTVAEECCWVVMLRPVRIQCVGVWIATKLSCIYIYIYIYIHTHTHTHTHTLRKLGSVCTLLPPHNHTGKVSLHLAEQEDLGVSGGALHPLWTLALNGVRWSASRPGYLPPWIPGHQLIWRFGEPQSRVNCFFLYVCFRPIASNTGASDVGFHPDFCVVRGLNRGFFNFIRCW